MSTPTLPQLSDLGNDQQAQFDYLWEAFKQTKRYAGLAEDRDPLGLFTALEELSPEDLDAFYVHLLDKAPGVLGRIRTLGRAEGLHEHGVPREAHRMIDALYKWMNDMDVRIKKNQDGTYALLHAVSKEQPEDDYTGKEIFKDLSQADASAYLIQLFLATEQAIIEAHPEHKAFGADIVNSPCVKELELVRQSLTTAAIFRPTA